MSKNIDIGIVDNMWDTSLHPDAKGIDLWATSPTGLNNGWYRAYISWNGTIVRETRMLPDGNYDTKPSTNRPNMKTVVDAIPAEHAEIVTALKKAYQVAYEKEYELEK